MDKKIADGPNTLFYRDEGAGLPVVLLHGFAEDGAIWNNQIEQLRSTYRLLVPDLPGSGLSTPSSGESPTTTTNRFPADTTTGPASEPLTTTITGTASEPPTTATTSRFPTSMESLAETILTLLNHENIGQCVLIGHSMGGYAALAFAEKYPERLKGLGLFHSTAYPDSEEKKTARRKSNEFIRKNGAAPFIRQSIPNLFSAGTRTNHAHLIQTMIDRYSAFSPDSLIDYYEAMIRRPDRTAVLRNAAIPVLFVIGKEDQAVPPEHALQQSHLPSLSHIHILEHSAHMGMLEEPDRSNHLLQSYLNFIIHT